MNQAGMRWREETLLVWPGQWGPSGRCPLSSMTSPKKSFKHHQHTLTFIKLYMLSCTWFYTNFIFFFFFILTVTMGLMSYFLLLIQFQPQEALYTPKFIIITTLQAGIHTYIYFLYSRPFNFSRREERSCTLLSTSTTINSSY